MYFPWQNPGMSSYSSRTNDARLKLSRSLNSLILLNFVHHLIILGFVVRLYFAVLSQFVSYVTNGVSLLRLPVTVTTSCCLHHIRFTIIHAANGTKSFS
jgi:hypothetical protein